MKRVVNHYCYQFLKLTLDNEEFNSFDKKKIVRFKKMGQNCDVLIENNEENKTLNLIKMKFQEDIYLNIKEMFLRQIKEQLLNNP